MVKVLQKPPPDFDIASQPLIIVRVADAGMSHIDQMEMHLREACGVPSEFLVRLARESHALCRQDHT